MLIFKKFEGDISRNIKIFLLFVCRRNLTSMTNLYISSYHSLEF
eukprot:UN04061